MDKQNTMEGKQERSSAEAWHLAHNLKVLEGFRTLSDGWKGEGSRRISEAAIEKARKLLPDLVPQPEVYPLGSGKVQLEFVSPGATHLLVAIDETGELDCVELSPDDAILEFWGDYSAAVLNQIVSELDVDSGLPQ